MKLPFELPFGKKVTVEYFLALIIRDEKITAVIFEEQNGTLRLIGDHDEYFTTSLDETSYEELLELVDKCVSTAESSLPEGIESQKTIFGLKADWVEESQIKKDYLITLKKISDTLGFSPIGFLVIPEAITHLLSKDEGAPISGILVEIGKTHISVSIVRAGRVLDTRKAKIEDSVAQTTDRILHHFTKQEILPSRIILFDGSKTEELQQEFVSHSWSKSLPFLHMPQTTILPNRYDAKAVLFGAATQMGFDVLGENEVKTEKPKKDPKDEVAQVSEEETESTKQQNTTASEFGFVVNGDIEKTAQEKVTEKEYEEEPEEEIEEERQIPYSSTPSVLKRIQTVISSIPVAGFLTGILSTILHLTSSIKIPLKLPKTSGKKPIIICVGAIILIISLYLLYTYTVSATVTIFVSPKTIDKTETITFSSDKPTDISEKRIFVEEISTSKEGNLATSATGTKEVGEKAKGSIIILSSLTNEQTIASGTTVTSSNGLAFALDNAVKIASSSGISDVKSIQAAITAKDIGKEHNLPSGTKFSVGNFERSSVEAKNDSPLSGGSKKEVTVVAQKDIDALSKDLPKNLEGKAKEEIQGKIQDDKELLPNFFEATLSKKEFDKDLLEEAKTVQLKATVTFNGLAYNKNDVKQLFTSLLAESDSSMQLVGSRVDYEVKNIKKQKNGDITAEMQLQGGLIPKIEAKQLIQDIRGKSFEDAISELKKIDQVADIEIKRSPPIPFLPSLLPTRSENIEVVVKTNE